MQRTHPGSETRTGPPCVIAHRGASALLPEHTLAAYAQAIADGADFIEPDLVPTRDGVLVARHESELGGTTDVAGLSQFASRRATRIIDGKTIEGWFTEDFTLAELRTLRVRERLPHLRTTAFDGQFAIATFAEIVELVADGADKRGAPIGLIPEIKHPTHFRALGLGLEERLLDALAGNAYTRAAPVVIQSFEPGSLRTLRARLGDAHANVRLLQLIGPAQGVPADLRNDSDAMTYATMTTREGLRAIAGYADSIGPSARTVVPVDAAGRLAAPTTLVEEAHAAGLQVMPYTFRPENHFLPRALWLGDEAHTVNAEGSIAQIRAHLDAGVDGFFTDHPAIGRAAVDARPA